MPPSFWCFPGHTGDWYYKYTSPAGGSCSASAVTGTSVDLTGLDGNTSYTYKAYSDSGCNTELASETFLTKPDALEHFLVADLHHSLGVLWKPPPGLAPSVLVQWKSGGQGYEASREKTFASGRWGFIENLSNGTTYTLRLQAKNTTGTSAWSAETSATPKEAKIVLRSGSGQSISGTGCSEYQTGCNDFELQNWGTNYWWKVTESPKHEQPGSCQTGTSPTEGFAAAAATAGRDWRMIWRTGTIPKTSVGPGAYHTIKAYSNSGCTDEIASYRFLTAPSPPVNFQATIIPSGTSYQATRFTWNPNPSHSGEIVSGYSWQSSVINRTTTSPSQTGIFPTGACPSKLPDAACEGTTSAVPVGFNWCFHLYAYNESGQSVAARTKDSNEFKICLQLGTITPAPTQAPTLALDSSGGIEVAWTPTFPYVENWMVAYCGPTKTEDCDSISQQNIWIRNASSEWGRGWKQFEYLNYERGESKLDPYPEYIHGSERRVNLPGYERTAGLSPGTYRVVYGQIRRTDGYLFWSPPSPVAQITIPEAPLKAPQNLTATAAANQTVELSWTKPEGETRTGWEYRQRSARENWQDWQAMESPVCCTYTVTGLTGGLEYDFQIRALNGTDKSAASNIASATPESSKPEKISAPYVVYDYEFNNMKLAWNATKWTRHFPSGDSTRSGTYKIRWRPNGTQTWTEASSITGTEHQIPSPTLDVEYEMQVQACVDVTGKPESSVCGDWSDSVLGTLLSSKYRLDACEIGPDSAALTVDGAYAGDWWYKAPATSCSNQNITGNSGTVKNLTANTKYAFAAYSDSACTKPLATLPGHDFTTAPRRPPAWKSAPSTKR